jgi:SAM-dependent methyltransferase
MTEQGQGVARHLPPRLGNWLERSHQRYRDELEHRTGPFRSLVVLWRAAFRVVSRSLKRTGSQHVDARGLAIPPPEMIRLVSGHDDADVWLRSGRQDAGLIRDMVERNCGPIEDLGAILDLACGCGRVARWWDGLEGPELFGCDYDGRLATWCRRHLAFLTVQTNRSWPPLPFPSQRFDLVYALSLFTHLSETAQYSWMREIRRVLKPGGLLLFTVSGERLANYLEGDPRIVFALGGHVVVRPERSGMQDCAAFHPATYVREQFLPSAGFELLESVDEDAPQAHVYSPMAHQDCYLVQKNDRVPGAS